MEALILFLAILSLVVLFLSWTHNRGGPWLPSRMEMVHKLLQLADVKPDEVVYDLGCGDGRVLVTAARKYGARAVGIELDPLRFTWCQLLITVLGLRSRVKVIRGDLFKIDVSQADVVFCYLLPNVYPRLEKKLLSELRPGTRVISHTFPFPQVKLSKQDGKARLYIFSYENTLIGSLKNKSQDSEI
jgi:cyclopropane fatty-acyl-phospholipid synthase-like methyltransferase